MIFGALLLFGTLRFISKGWVSDLYIEPSFFFGYLGFEWVKPLSGNWMYLPFILLILGSTGIILGLFYRFSAILAFISFTYIELLDKTNYLNHYYFVSLMCFILILVPANQRFSLDSWRKKNSGFTTLAWHIDLIKFQLAVVYIFAGIAKLNSDWLFDAQPLKIWLQAHHSLPLVGDLLQQEWMAYLFSWFGCLYDLFIVFFLLTAKTRKLAYFFVVVFHLVTWYLFPIGVFPWVMIFSTLIFFAPTWHEKVLHFFEKRSKENTLAPIKPLQNSGFVRYFLIVFVVVQLLVPFRYLLYPGNLFWTEEGFRFSWRVMLIHKEGNANFYVKDQQTGREIELNNSTYLTESQIDQMATQPDMILQYAKFLEHEFSGKVLTFGNQTFHLNKVSVHAQIFVSLNGRNSQLFVAKKHNLAALPYNLSHRNWIEPFKP